MTLKYSNGTRDAQQQGLIAYAGANAIIKIYDGLQPANANTAVTTQTLLVSLPIAGTFGTDASGTLTIGSVTPTDAVANGTASWFRIVKADGTTVVMDGSVGTSGTDMIFPTTTFTVGLQIAISAGTIIRGNQ